MANTAKPTGPKTPPPGGGDPVIKSTPNAVGTAVISEHIDTVGTNVDDVRQWIKRDIEHHDKCGIDEMLEELLYGCSDQLNSESGSNEKSGQTSKQKSKQKSKKPLLKDVLDDVLGICDDRMKKEMTQHLSRFAKCETEPPSYEHFVRAANYALDKLSKLKARGIISSNDDNDHENILFHHNDIPIKQKHQGVDSQRKPDVVVVSHASARGVMKEEDQNCGKAKLFSTACKQPHGRFQWVDVLSTFEFKRSKGSKMEGPEYDNLKISDSCDLQHMEYGKRSGKATQPTGSTSAVISDQTESTELRRSARLGSNNGEKKRPSDNQVSNERGSKRIKSNDDRDTEKLRKKIDPMEQNGLYAAEMFAAHVARQHVLSCVVNNEMIYIWYFDRQDAIQSAGFNFIRDLPRFLSLLLIMQRLPYSGWGHNPLFEPEPGSSDTIEIYDEERKINVDLQLDFDSPDRTTHYGLRGRATNVFPVKSKALSKLAKQLANQHPSRNQTQELVAKIYWPEESRESEADILQKVQRIAANHPEVRDHGPDVVWFHKFESTSTAKIREALGIDDAKGGHRALYIIVFRKLQPITELSGDEFLRAWWHAVACHRVLWEFGVRHRDISPSNLMYYRLPSGQVIGVLNDYDLSSTNVIPTGRERTGTVPFMAMELLSHKAIEGKVEHLYRHDAESFIWVLTWVCLRYEDGKLRRNDRPFDDWLKVDAIGCYKEKAAFLLEVMSNTYVEPLASHQANWEIALSCLRRFFVILYPQSHRSLELDDEHVFQTWLCAQVPPSLRE